MVRDAPAALLTIRGTGFASPDVIDPLPHGFRPHPEEPAAGGHLEGRGPNLGLRFP